MTTKLHDGRFHVCAGHGGQMFADRNGTGEGHQPDRRLRDQVFGNVGRSAEHEVQYAGRQAGIDERLHELHRAGRRFLRCLQDDRASRRQSTAHLARRRAHREVPGRERGHHADRLTQHGMSHAGFAGDDPPVDAATLLCVPLDDVAAAQDLQARLADRFALFQSHRDCHVLDALAHETRGFEDDLGAFRRRRARPDLEALFRRSERVVQVRACRVRHSAENGFIGRIDHRLAVSPAPFAIDIQLEIGIICHSSELLSICGGQPRRIRWRITRRRPRYRQEPGGTEGGMSWPICRSGNSGVPDCR